MVNYTHKDLFLDGNTERQIQIAFDGGIITNKEMHQGSFELTESLCSEEGLTFGTCEASVLKFKVHNVVTSLKGKTLTVTEILNGNTSEPFYYGKYKVDSDKPTADRKFREIVAYDVMYDILNADVASWYNGLTYPCSIGYFRNKLLSHLDIEVVDTELVNDGIYIDKTIDVDELSAKTVLNAICELNGCFGHINRYGKFEFKVLQPIIQGLYPSETLYPSDNLFPKEANSSENFYKSRYISCKYEDFVTSEITGLQIRQEEDDIGATVGTTSNVYVIEDNFLVYGKSHDDLVTIGNNLLSVIGGIYYRPIVSLKTSGKPYLEVGDNITVGSSEVVIETYILERVISGVVGQKDEFISKGTETYGKELNGLNKQITQIKGKYNKLTRTVDETRLEMGDIEQGLYSTISVTASELRTELTDTANDLQSQITQNADSISLEVKRAQEAESSLSVKANEISANVTTISTNLENNYYTITETDTKISASSEGILLSVSQTYETISSASSSYSSLQSQISVNAENISLKVSAGEVISAINVSSDAIRLSSGRLIITSGNFQLHENGDCYIKGEVEATSGYIGGFSITPSDSGGWLENGDTIITEHTSYFGAVYTDDINGYTPITSGNINNYVTDYGTTISGIETELGNLSTQYWSLDKRISALEAAI